MQQTTNHQDTPVMILPVFADLHNHTLHLLCYFLRDRLSDQRFVDDFETLLSNGRGETLIKARIARINQVFGPDCTTPLLKRPLEFADIAAYSTNASRRHFALALSQRLGIEDKKTIHQIIGNASPAYLQSGIALDAVADFIKKQHLLAVLAHPAAGSFPGKGHYKEVLPPLDTVEKMLPEFLAAGIQGIEVFYPGHTKEHRAVLLSWAKTRKLLVTGGSDCHDDTERPPQWQVYLKRISNGFMRLCHRIQRKKKTSSGLLLM
jgi:3',5'-nucleoside bisphosphate phosphatase